MSRVAEVSGDELVDKISNCQSIRERGIGTDRIRELLGISTDDILDRDAVLRANLGDGYFPALDECSRQSMPSRDRTGYMLRRTSMLVLFDQCSDETGSYFDGASDLANDWYAVRRAKHEVTWPAIRESITSRAAAYLGTLERGQSRTVRKLADCTYRG